jgi:23S rRNA maturation mini-RNase III
MRPKVKYEEEISKRGENEKGETIKKNEVRSRRIRNGVEE